MPGPGSAGLEAFEKALSDDSAQPRPTQRPGRQLGPTVASSLTPACSRERDHVSAGRHADPRRMLPANPRARRKLRRVRGRNWLVIGVDPVCPGRGTSCWCWRAAPDVLGEERQDPLPGIRRRSGVVDGQLVVKEGMLGARVDLEVVRDTSDRQLGFRCPGGFGGDVLIRPGADDRAQAADRVIRAMPTARLRPSNRSTLTAAYPSAANRWRMPRMLSLSPKASWTTTTPGCGPGPSGRAR